MTAVPEPIVIGLGGNLGGSAAVMRRFAAAKQSLAFYGSVRAAQIYRTAPLGGVAQPAFFNSALAVTLARSHPVELIALLLELERMLGRDRSREERWGPRAIDLDVLVWGTRTIAIPALTVPHPRLHERRFALAPLVELLGEDFEIPGQGRAGTLLAAVAAQDVVAVAAFR